VTRSRCPAPPPSTRGVGFVTSVSCPPVGSCAADGEYYDNSSGGQAFVISQN
jgi:hypothetical protein